MKKAKLFVVMLIFFAALTNVTACKNKNKESTDPATTNMNADSMLAPAPAPVEISGDEQLKQGVTDALKDYPSVNAEVADSVITLTGEIKRADWQKLNPTLNSLRPKRINSTNLSIK